MSPKLVIVFALAGAALIWGCATQRERIEKRIGQKAVFFATLPPEKQQQLREGIVSAGDAQEAAWIVYGPPDRIFQRVTGTSTNEIWSYVSYDVSYVDSPRPVYHPVRVSRGRTFWLYDTVWATDIYHNPYEYRRIEFHDGRILSFQSEQQGQTRGTTGPD